jgi:hypothetical protein
MLLYNIEMATRELRKKLKEENNLEDFEEQDAKIFANSEFFQEILRKTEEEENGSSGL